MELKTWSSLSSGCRLYPPGRSPLRDGVEQEGGLQARRAESRARMFYPWTSNSAGMFMKPLWRRILGPALSIVLFTAAVWLLHSELRNYHLRDILNALQSLTAERLAAAVGLTILSYTVMTGYDVLALRYIRHPLAYPKVGLASFIGYAFSNNIGMSMVAGASVRYRLYSAWGLSSLQIMQVVAFCTLTLWLGFFAIGGAVFLAEPPVVPAVIHLPLDSLRVIGIVMLAGVLAYGIATLSQKTAVTIRGWEIRLPSVRLLVAQLVIAALDWMLASFVLFVLLAPGSAMSYPAFLAVYLLAQLAGLVSQVPGGLGVFETVIVLMLSARLPASQIFGALLGYRALYYWLCANGSDCGFSFGFSSAGCHPWFPRYLRRQPLSAAPSCSFRAPRRWSHSGSFF